MRAEDWSEVKRKLRKPTQQLPMRRYDHGSSGHVSWCQLFENLQLTGRLELTGRHCEQQVPQLYLGWQHVLGLVGYWVQKTAKKWTVPQGMTRQVLAMMWREDFVLAGPMSLNLRVRAATTWSLPLLPATPADPLPVKVKRQAGLDLLLLLQEASTENKETTTSTWK
ncbi:PREDICTED: uncharacterized protein LOC107327873 [Acropora digitifera]|uniref:uncharacterized protein LOC107327873 n=1 Tax=Acropora digitifera TaxID=70779 RepID=UPI00077A33C8|nr:PREDICTED: uncharacterized protein LOC107327873 [Acropora digitifera]